MKVHETNNGFRMAITGSRDRTIRLWDLNKVIVEENPTNWSPCSLAAHDVSVIRSRVDVVTLFVTNLKF